MVESRHRLKSSLRWLGERATLIALVIIQPILVTITLNSRMSTTVASGTMLASSLIIVSIGIDAAIRIRRRRPANKNLRPVHRSICEDVMGGASDLLTPLVFLISIQLTFRRTFAIATDPESIRLLGYTPSDQIVEILTFGTGIWALVSAYVVKYYWDDLVATIEDRLKQQGDGRHRPPSPCDPISLAEPNADHPSHRP